MIKQFNLLPHDTVSTEVKHTQKAVRWIKKKKKAIKV